jgi:hypothetical protein
MRTRSRRDACHPRVLDAKFLTQQRQLGLEPGNPRGLLRAHQWTIFETTPDIRQRDASERDGLKQVVLDVVLPIPRHWDFLHRAASLSGSRLAVHRNGLPASESLQSVPRQVPGIY